MNFLPSFVSLIANQKGNNQQHAALSNNDEKKRKRIYNFDTFLELKM